MTYKVKRISHIGIRQAHHASLALELEIAISDLKFPTP